MGAMKLGALLFLVTTTSWAAGPHHCDARKMSFQKQAAALLRHLSALSPNIAEIAPASVRCRETEAVVGDHRRCAYECLFKEAKGGPAEARMTLTLNVSRKDRKGRTVEAIELLSLQHESNPAPRADD